jgi:hypothetical protein
MIQLFDTHRLSYRNAKLRAWDLATRTQRVTFQNYDSTDEHPQWQSIGADVITDESGYLFSADGTQKIECLGVEEAAIVDVSLDGGNSYLIQFVIQPDHDPAALSADDIYGLTYRNSNGEPETYNPVDGPKTLPDYLLKSEYSQGDWREQTIITKATDINGSPIVITNFTHLILITSGSSSDGALITFELPSDKALRNGQVITIYSGFDIDVSFKTVDSPTQRYRLLSNHVYVLHNNRSKNKLILTNITGTLSTIATRQVTLTGAATSIKDIQVGMLADTDKLANITIDASNMASGITDFAVHVPIPDNHSCDIVVKVHGYTGNFGIELLEGTISEYSSMSAQAVFTAVAGDVLAYFHLVKIGTNAGASTLLNKS